MSDKIKLSYNNGIINKPLRNESIPYATGFRSIDVSIDELIDLIKKGYAFSAQFKNGYRKTENFICSDFVAVDIDSGLTLEEAKSNEFIQSNALFIYTTPSHTEKANRFRIVFQTPHTIIDKDEWKKSLQGVGRKFGGDPAVKDGARLFYGNTEAQIFRFDQKLSEEAFKEIVDLSVSKIKQNNNLRVTYSSNLTVGLDDYLTTAFGAIRQLKDIPLLTSIYCPKHIDNNASAFTLESTQGIKGVHCATCDMTFWSEPFQRFDFDAFDHLISQMGKAQKDSEEVEWFEEKRKENKVIQIEERYLPPITYTAGVTLIRSPKGSGKTAALKNLVQNIKSFSETKLKTDFPRSILLIGHRQTLLREACNKLGLQCYLDSEPTNFYGVSLDSIGTKLNRKIGRPPYDLILIDESEQVFSHLTSETITQKPGALSNIFKHLEYYLKASKSIIALDADLGNITISALRLLKNKEWKDSLRIISNESKTNIPKVPIHLFKSRGQLIEELIDALRRGEKCLVTSNTRARIDDIYLKIKEQVKGKYIKITSDNSQDGEIIEFVKNINERAKEYDAILASPSLGTGVDITFPNNEIIFQNVFGFFEPFINTHTDIDQQLARVRHTNRISVHINPRSFAIETDLNLITESLGRGGISEAALTIADNGDYVVNKEDPLLQIYSAVVAYQNASKSNLLKNFCNLKAKQSINIIEVKKDKRKAKSGNKKLKESRKERIDEQLKEYFIAAPLSEEEFRYLYARRLSKERMRIIDRIRLEKYLVEKSFDVKIDIELLQQIVDGNFLEKMKMLKSIISNQYIEHSKKFAMTFIEDENVYLRKMPIENLVEVTLALCGFIKDGRIDFRHTVTQSELAPFIKFCKRNYVMMGEILGTPIRKDFETRALLTLNPILSEAGLVLERMKVKRKAGKATTVYGFHPKKIRRLDQYLSNYTPITDRTVLEAVGCVKDNGELDYRRFKDRYRERPASFFQKNR